MKDQESIQKSLRNRRIAEMIAQEIYAGFDLPVSGGYVYEREYYVPESTIEFTVGKDRLTVVVHDNNIAIYTIALTSPEDTYSYFFSDTDNAQNQWSELPVAIQRTRNWLAARADKVQHPRALFKELGKPELETMPIADKRFRYAPTISKEIATKILESNPGQDVDGFTFQDLTNLGRDEHGDEVARMNLEITGTGNYVGFLITIPNNPEFIERIITDHDGNVRLKPVNRIVTLVPTVAYERADWD